MIMLNPRLRDAIMDRDKGICSVCGLDTVEVGKTLSRLCEQAAAEAAQYDCRFDQARAEQEVFERLAMQEVGRVPFCNRRTAIAYAVHVDPDKQIDIYNEPPENLLTMCDWCHWPEYYRRLKRQFQHEARGRETPGLERLFHFEQVALF